jgi:CheY-like chemotaxis protein
VGPRAASVLVVDDNEDVRKLTCRILQFAGYQVREASDGYQALAVLNQSGPVDAVVADIRMPKMDGWELAARLAKRTPRPPILFISAYDAHIGSSLPGPVLGKPFRSETLIDQLRQVLARAQ